MNVPGIARATFESLRNQPLFLGITQFIIEHLKRISNKSERARFVHNVIDQYNEEVFSHPLVKEHMPCKTGCSACCHTQVSVTSDEAELLASLVDEGIEIDENRLKLQMAAENDSDLFFQISFNDRKCVFLNDQGSCKVYKDRPSVCRTNAVLGTADQCDTSSEQKSIRLIRTPKSDMAIIGAFAASDENGSLPFMLGKLLLIKKKKKISGRPFFKKNISKDQSI